MWQLFMFFFDPVLREGRRAVRLDVFREKTAIRVYKIHSSRFW
jgi:hypothetical protein